jgi:hypothetical protein
VDDFGTKGICMNQIMVNAVEFDSLLKEVEYLKHENQKLKEQLKDMNELRQAAEMALKALENMSPDTDTLVEVEPHVWEYRGSLVIQALRQALAQPDEVLAEREACAKVCLEGTDMPVQVDALKIIRAERERISNAIRARGEI